MPNNVDGNCHLSLKVKAVEIPSVCNACVVTVGCSGLFADVRQGLETAENVAGSAVYAAPANIGGIGRTRGRRVRILSPRPPLLKFIPLESDVYGHER
jgi:hypothetical protein